MGRGKSNAHLKASAWTGQIAGAQVPLLCRQDARKNKQYWAAKTPRRQEGTVMAAKTPRRQEKRKPERQQPAERRKGHASTSSGHGAKQKQRVPPRDPDADRTGEPPRRQRALKIALAAFAFFMVHALFNFFLGVLGVWAAQSRSWRLGGQYCFCLRVGG